MIFFSKIPEYWETVASIDREALWLLLASLIIWTNEWVLGMGSRNSGGERDQREESVNQDSPGGMATADIIA